MFESHSKNGAWHPARARVSFIDGAGVSLKSIFDGTVASRQVVEVRARLASRSAPFPCSQSKGSVSALGSILGVSGIVHAQGCDSVCGNAGCGGLPQSENCIGENCSGLFTAGFAAGSPWDSD